MIVYRFIDRLFLGVDRVVGAIAGACLLVITAVLFVNSVGRYVAGITFIGGEELARYLMIWLTFLGSYLLVRRSRHISVDLVMRTLPPAYQRLLGIAISAFGAIVLGYFAWFGAELTALIMSSGQVSSSLPIRTGWLYLSVPVGAALMTAAFLWNVVRALIGDQTNVYDDEESPDAPSEQHPHLKVGL